MKKAEAWFPRQRTLREILEAHRIEQAANEPIDEKTAVALVEALNDLFKLSESKT